MFGDTLRNKLLRKMSIHTYPHKSYLPIFDGIKLVCSSLLRLRRNKFCIVQRRPNAGISKTPLLTSITNYA